jgi:uncharacterized damage-inducible protein DinB
MTVDDLNRRYDYGYWANQRLFGVVAQLTTEEFTRTVGGSWGSTRNTLVHTMSAEWGWIDRCGGPPRGPALNADDYPSADSLIRQWTVVEGYVRAFLGAFGAWREPRRAPPRPGRADASHARARAWELRSALLRR